MQNSPRCLTKVIWLTLWILPLFLWDPSAMASTPEPTVIRLCDALTTGDTAAIALAADEIRTARREGQAINGILMSLARGPEGSILPPGSLFRDGGNPVPGVILMVDIPEPNIFQSPRVEVRFSRRDNLLAVSVSAPGNSSGAFTRIFTSAQYVQFMQGQSIRLDPLMLGWEAHGISTAELANQRALVDPFFVEPGKVQPLPVLGTFGWYGQALTNQISDLQGFSRVVIANHVLPSGSDRYVVVPVEGALDIVKPGDRLLINGLERGPRLLRAIVIQREDDSLVIFEEEARRYYRMPLAAAIRYAGLENFITHRSASADLARDFQTQLRDISSNSYAAVPAEARTTIDFEAVLIERLRGGFRWIPANLNPQESIDLVSNLMVGDELHFYDRSKQKWRTLVYANHWLTRRYFYEFEQHNSFFSSYPQFEQFSFDGDDLIGPVAVPGTVFLRTASGRARHSQMHESVYPTLSQAFRERLALVEEADQGVTREIRRLEQAMRSSGMSDSGLNATARTIEHIMRESQIIHIEGMNRRRQMELSSIRAMRGINPQARYNPNLVINRTQRNIYLTDALGALQGRNLSLDLFWRQGVAEPRSAFVEMHDGEAVVLIALQTEIESSAVFAQVMESAYAISLEEHTHWFPNNIHDHRYGGDTSGNAMVSGDRQYFHGRAVINPNNRSGLFLRISLAEHAAQYRSSGDLLTGLVWGHSLRFSQP